MVTRRVRRARSGRRRGPCCPSISSVASITTTSRWIGTDTVPADAGAGAEGDVDRAEDLLVLEHVARQLRAIVGADAELGEVASRARRARPAARGTRGPSPRVAAAIRPFSTVRIAGSLLRPSGARLEATIVPVAAERGDEPLAAREVSERAPARSGRRRRRCPAGRSRSSVRSEPRGQVTRAGAPALEQRRNGLRASRHRVEVDGHHAREHVVGDARHRRAARAGVGRALARAGVAERRLVGAMNTSQAASAAAIAGGGSVPSVARSSMTASTASADASEASSRSASPMARVRRRRSPARPRRA